jgi:hypothetical protein
VTFSPLCKPTPVTLTEFFRVRCLTIADLVTEIMGIFYHMPVFRQRHCGILTTSRH